MVLKYSLWSLVIIVHLLSYSVDYFQDNAIAINGIESTYNMGLLINPWLSNHYLSYTLVLFLLPHTIKPKFVLIENDSFFP